MMVKNVAPIAMPGKASNRTDKGLVQRVQKVQRDAKLNRASGGEYNARNTANSLMVNSNMPTTGSAVSQQVQVPQVQTPVPSGVQAIGAFEPGNASNVPFSEGSPYGPGANSSNYPMVQAPDNGSALARALLAQNPTNPQLAAIVNAFNEAGM